MTKMFKCKHLFLCRWRCTVSTWPMGNPGESLWVVLAPSQRMTSGWSDWWDIIINCALLNCLSIVVKQKVNRKMIQKYTDAF